MITRDIDTRVNIVDTNDKYKRRIITFTIDDVTFVIETINDDEIIAYTIWHDNAMTWHCVASSHYNESETQYDK